MASEANIPIKIAEISANRYNEQILHKVSLLKNYRSNFEKALKLKDFERLKKDQINSTKTVKQMKTLLQDLEQLKQKVLEDDRDKFDKLTGDAKAEALKEIRNHLDLNPAEKVKNLTPSYSEESPETSPLKERLIENVQLQIDMPEYRRKQLEAKEAYLQEFENLQREAEDLYGIFKNVNEMVVVQAEHVDHVQENVEVAQVEVEAGEQQLATALKYKQTMYPILGGLMGMAVCGPVGLVVGLKAGSLACVSGGIVGFAGGKFLKKANKVEVPQDIKND